MKANETASTNQLIKKGNIFSFVPFVSFTNFIRITFSNRSPSIISQLLTRDTTIGGATWLAQIKRETPIHVKF